MDEIQNCIADAHYTDAIKDGEGIQPLMKIPGPPQTFNAEEFLQSKKVDYETAITMPLAFFYLKQRSKEAEAIFSFLEDYDKYKSAVKKRFEQAKNFLENPSFKGLPEEFESTKAGIKKGFGHENVNSKEHLEVLFDGLAKQVKDKGSPIWEEFKSSPDYLVFAKKLWYTYQPVTMNDFAVFRDLGRGAFGVVSGAKHSATGHLTAVKAMNRRLVKGKKALKLVVAEKAILAELGDKPSLFVIRLEYSFVDGDNFYLCLPLCTGGDLMYHLNGAGKTLGYFPFKQTQFYAAEIALGLEHLHSLGIIYRDLKPENVLLDEKGHCRISDLGLAVNVGGKKIKGRAGTPGYWPPEMLKKEKYGYGADWWSYGIMVYEFLAGVCPMSKKISKMERDKATLEWTVSFPNHLGSDDGTEFPAAAKQFIKELLVRKEDDRLGSGKDGGRAVRKHDFFDGLRFSKLRTHSVDPPWTPPKNAINAMNQSDIEDKDKEHAYRKEKLTAEDELKDFSYVAMNFHQERVIEVLALEKKGGLDYLEESSEGGCCTVS